MFRAVQCDGGGDDVSGSLFSYVDLEARIPRRIRCAIPVRW